MLFISHSTNRLTGTDGFRLLCHQFIPSSLSRLATCISRYNTFWQKMNSFREAPFLFSRTDDQGRTTRNTVFPLNTGPQSCIGWWIKKNRCAQWRQAMASRRKRSVASFFMLRSSLDSKKRNGAQAGLSPSEQQALFLVPLEASPCSLARSAPVLPGGVEAA
jgi:hypothetical protein